MIWNKIVKCPRCNFYFRKISGNVFECSNKDCNIILQDPHAKVVFKKDLGVYQLK